MKYFTSLSNLLWCPTRNPFSDKAYDKIIRVKFYLRNENRKVSSLFKVFLYVLNSGCVAGLTTATELRMIYNSLAPKQVTIPFKTFSFSLALSISWSQAVCLLLDMAGNCLQASVYIAIRNHFQLVRWSYSDGLFPVT